MISHESKKIQIDFTKSSTKEATKHCQRRSRAIQPTLGLNAITDYLSIKEQIKCKSLCHSSWDEVKMREKKSDTLVWHLGPCPLEFPIEPDEQP